MDEKKIEKKGAWLLLRMVQEKIYYRCEGQHSQKLGHLGKTRMDVNRLIWAMWGKEVAGGAGEEERVLQPGGPKEQRGQRVGGQHCWSI